MLINGISYSLKALFRSRSFRGIFLLIVLLDYIGIWVPRFCYHDKLSISGSCRMCLVEVTGSVKAVVSCSTVVHDGMEVFTNSFFIRKSREHIMEFLLINHPLDCPICDQAGECDLQDLALVYGSDDGRFRYKKKAILNKNLGSIIKTNMNRCIYCTRCVRYTSELNNVYLFNTLGRGGSTEIGLYDEEKFVEENYINGNVIDLCPVGALTAKPYSFRNRTWEIVSVESIDILDSLCSSIRIDVRNNVVERILPKPNNNVNEEWISDKIRFCYDGLKKQRLSFPFYKFYYKKRQFYVLCSWFFIFNKMKINYNLKYNACFNNDFLHIFTGNLIDLFTLHVLKEMSHSLGIANINTNLYFNIDLRKYFVFNNTISNLEYHNLFIILGSNPKVDSPILNMKIRHIKYRYNKKVQVIYIGSKLFLNYTMAHLGITSEVIISLLLGKTHVCYNVERASSVVWLYSVGISLFLNNILFISLDLLSFFLKNKTFIYSYITLFSSDVSVYELGVMSSYHNKNIYMSSTKSHMCYFIGFDSDKFWVDSGSSYNIYHGHHGDVGASNSCVILPSNTFIENTSFFYNCEGRMSVSNIAVQKKKKICNTESVLYNFFSYLFNGTHNTLRMKMKRLFLLFFYKNAMFFTKYKYSNRINIRCLPTSNIYSFYKYVLFTVINHFFDMDVFSKCSYYILDLNVNDQSHNFI